MAPDTETFISVKDAAEILNLAPYAVLELLNSGDIKSRRSVDLDSVLEYTERGQSA